MAYSSNYSYGGHGNNNQQMTPEDRMRLQTLAGLQQLTNGMVQQNNTAGLSGLLASLLYQKYLKNRDDVKYGGGNDTVPIYDGKDTTSRMANEYLGIQPPKPNSNTEPLTMTDIFAKLSQQPPTLTQYTPNADEVSEELGMFPEERKRWLMSRQ